MEIYLFLFLFNLIFLIFNKSIANILNLYDSPNAERKIHKSSIPITGGLIIFLNFLIFYIYAGKIFDNNLNSNLFLITSIILFLLGIIDDKFDIQSNIKFLLLTLIIFPIVYLDQGLHLDNIRLSFLDNEYNIGKFGIAWTILCLLLFINALNMFDGINLQVGLYSLFILTFFILSNLNITLFIFIFIGILSFLFLNFKSKSFLGDGGSYLIAFIIGYSFIKMYDAKIIYYADQIVLFMVIPGYDLMRLFAIRILNKKNPFSADKNHLHHLLLTRFPYYAVITIIQLLVFVPIIFSILFGHTLFFIFISLIIYTFIVYRLS